MNTNMMLIGGIAVAGIAVALFFLRFWRSTGDRFFLYFALAFVLDGYPSGPAYQFGSALSLSPQGLAVGDSNDSELATYTGAAYVFAYPLCR